jgi:hypothetical protein
MSDSNNQNRSGPDSSGQQRIASNSYGSSSYSKPLTQDIHPLGLNDADESSLLAFDKFIQAVVRGTPNSETVASLNDLRHMLESNFENDFRPDQDQIDYMRSKQTSKYNKRAFKDWKVMRSKGSFGCKSRPRFVFHHLVNLWLIAINCFCSLIKL